MRNLGTVPLETARLRLRRLSAADAESMYTNWASDAQVTKYLRFLPHKNVAESRTILAEWDARYGCDTHYLWGIERKSDGVLIGTIGVSPGEHDETVLEAGYCIGRAYWNNGYVTEAYRAVLAFMFGAVGVPLMHCCHAVENPSSGRVMQKCGFAYTHDDEYHKFDGTAVPCRCYALTKEQYEQTKQEAGE